MVALPLARLWTAATAAFYLTVLVPGALAQVKPAAHYFVNELPGQPEGPLLRQHAGQIEITPDHHGKLFFWRFENRHIANKHRTVIWINGGPGCSSEDGALMEIGPYRLKDKETLEYNDGSWDEFANLVFVDNPVGTGFSSVDSDSYVHELTEMAANFIVFLEKYFSIFPEDQTNDLYIAGESYAGQHIPYIARSILDRNREANQAHPWNLQGLLIGNGWISPKDQSPAYLEYAYKAGLVEKGSTVADELEVQQAVCMTEMNSTDDGLQHVSYSNCEAILNGILEKTRSEGECYNMYDVRLKDSYPSCGMNWPQDLADVTPYLQRDDVVRALHVDEDTQPGWVECNGNVGNAFHPIKSPPAIDLMPGILAEIPVLLFSGEQDLICNHLGTEALIHNMEWNGGRGFEISTNVWAPRRDWTFEGEAAGIYQEARNLTYVLFYNSSHMVPFDYPRRTRDMLDRFMGVDIASVGGEPTESLLDGEKTSPSTSVGGHPNSTAAQEVEQQKLEEERWSAYYRSGAVALIVVAILALCFGWYVWQDRRRRSAGYRNVDEGFMPRRDVEATDFDEGELDDLSPDPDRKYSLGEASDEEDVEHNKLNGHSNGNGHTKYTDRDED